MFWIRKQLSVEKKISQINALLVRSFSNVKQDTQNIFQWLNYLYQKNLEQENRIKQLNLELSYMPKKPEEIKKIVDSYYSFDSMSERIKTLNGKIDALQAKAHAPIHSPEIEQRLATLEEQRKATIRQKVVQRITKNSKEYVKSLILSYIRKFGQISSLQLKEMIIQDQGLCSKSSFYRLMEEIEAMDEIGTAKKAREKYYIYHQIKAH
jgi:hypothetical protein